MKRIYNSKKEEEMEKSILLFDQRFKFVFYVVVLIVVFSAIYSLSLCDANGDSACSSLAKFYLKMASFFVALLK